MVVTEQYIVEIPNVKNLEDGIDEFHTDSTDRYYVEHYGWDFEEGDNSHLEEE